MSDNKYTDDVDPEKNVVVNVDVDVASDSVADGHTLHRTMKNRHIAMIRCVRVAISEPMQP